jgi:hypothetical protein
MQIGAPEAAVNLHAFRRSGVSSQSMKFGFWSGVSFQPDLNLMVWQPRGILDEPHVEQLISLLEHTEDEAERPFNRYTDLSRLDAVELTFKYVLKVSLYRRLVYGERSIVKSAFYAVDRATARVALTHATVTAYSPLQVKVFLRKSSAAKWLGVSITDLELDRFTP